MILSDDVWGALEGAIRLYDPQYVRLYTPIEARTLCQQADLQVKGQ